jgi:hypothetical protein
LKIVKGIFCCLFGFEKDNKYLFKAKNSRGLREFLSFKCVLIVFFLAQNVGKMDAKKESGSGDYLSQVFNNIKWESKVKPTTNRSGFLGKQMFESSFAYKYMWYKMEPEQIDFDNPFDVEEGNLIR